MRLHERVDGAQVLTTPTRKRVLKQALRQLGILVEGVLTTPTRKRVLKLLQAMSEFDRRNVLTTPTRKRVLKPSAAPHPHMPVPCLNDTDPQEGTETNIGDAALLGDSVS